MRYPTRDDPGPTAVRYEFPIAPSLESSVKERGVYRVSGINDDGPDALALLLPFLFVLSTLLFIMILFLVCILLLRRRRGISLGDQDGPVDVSRDDIFNDADGGIAGVEQRWLENLGEDIKRTYRQAKIYEAQYPPNSIPTDITLSQFLTIQEKGVSAWSFEPEYEALTPVLVHARTELTFLPDPASCSSVQSNLPIPKLNEVYYWEVKMFDLPPTTNVAVGLATKPYPTFRLPGWNKYSVAYHSNGDKSYNYPFTATPFGPPLREGDVLGVGYRPRSGTVFFTRNGRKTEEAFAGLSRWNMFPTVGADGPCSVHVNLGQAGFVFIEANVKKWGLAPSVGTLAPPPAYGAERGSILLEAGGAGPNSRTPGSSGRRSHNHRHRRPKTPGTSTLPHNPSPLRSAPLSPPPPFTPGESNARDGQQGILDRLNSAPSTSRAGPSTSIPRPLEPISASEEEEADRASTSSSQRTARNRNTGGPTTRVLPGSPEPEPDSPYIVNPPTPNVSDIHLRTLERTSVDLGRGRPPAEHPSHSRSNSPLAPPQQLSERQQEEQGEALVMSRARGLNPRRESQASRVSRSSGESASTESEGSVDESATTEASSAPAGPPPGYAVINPHIYASGVHIDLPADVIQAALDGRPVDSSSSNGAALNPGRGTRR